MEKTKETTYEELGEVERLKKRLAIVQKMLKESATEDAEETAIARAIRESVAARAEVPPARARKLGANIIKAAGILDIGDVHYGELVTDRSTGGVAEYSPEIAQARFDYTIEEAIKIGKHNKIQSLWFIMGGDMISGDIHDDLSRSNEVMPIEQTLDCAEMMYGGLERLCQEFPEVNVLGVSGNHARMYRKPFFNRKQIESLDYILYKMVEAKGLNQKNLSFHTPESFYTTIEVEKRKFLIMHGDTIKQQNSFSLPFYGMWKEFMKWKAMEDTAGEFDDMIVHHNHIPVALTIGEGMYYGNGALKGKDDFSLAGTRLPAPAAQRMLIVGDGKVLSDHLIESEYIGKPVGKEQV
jgi:hypothetical protein